MSEHPRDTHWVREWLHYARRHTPAQARNFLDAMRGLDAVGRLWLH
jgi:hypothetical protein